MIINNMKKIITIKAFDVFDEDGNAIAENLKTFKKAEAFVIAHDKKRLADWRLSYYRKPKRTEEFRHHRYCIFHANGKVDADDVLSKMSFNDICKEAFAWYVISVVEFKW